MASLGIQNTGNIEGGSISYTIAPNGHIDWAGDVEAHLGWIHKHFTFQGAHDIDPKFLKPDFYRDNPTASFSSDGLDVNVIGVDLSAHQPANSPLPAYDVHLHFSKGGFAGIAMLYVSTDEVAIVNLNAQATVYGISVNVIATE